MSTEASPAQNKNVNSDVTTTTTEPVVNTQVEPSSEQPKNTEELSNKVEDNKNTTADTTDANNPPLLPVVEDVSKTANTKLRAIFNTFSKGSKKEGITEEAPATTATTTNENITTTETKTGSSPPHSESKLSKGLGNFLSKVMPTTTKENETKAAHTTDTHPETTVEDHENAPAATTDVTQEETPSSADHVAQKRQSLLSKFFGSGKKKEDEHVEKEHENEEVEPNTEREVENVAIQETRSSSPPLGRRLTGFFSKKIPKLDKNKQHKSSDKLETSEGEPEAAEGIKEEGGPATTTTTTTTTNNTTNTAADKELPQQPVEGTATTQSEEATEDLQPNTLPSNTPAIIAK